MQPHRPEQGGDGRGGLLVEAIRLPVIADLGYRLSLVVGFEAVELVLQDRSAGLVEQTLQVLLQLEGGLRRDGGVAEPPHPFVDVLLEVLQRVIAGPGEGGFACGVWAQCDRLGHGGCLSWQEIS